MNPSKHADQHPLGSPGRPLDPADDHPDSVGGQSIAESDLDESELSPTYVPDSQREPVDHGR